MAQKRRSGVNPLNPSIPVRPNPRPKAQKANLTGYLNGSINPPAGSNQAIPRQPGTIELPIISPMGSLNQKAMPLPAKSVKPVNAKGIPKPGAFRPYTT